MSPDQFQDILSLYKHKFYLVHSFSLKIRTFQHAADVGHICGIKRIVKVLIQFTVLCCTFVEVWMSCVDIGQLYSNNVLHHGVGGHQSASQ